MNVILQWYGVVTAIFFGITAMLVQDEVKARTDFELERGRGTYNVFKYYQHLKMNHEKFSLKFKLFLLAHLNLIAFVIFLFVGFR
jgi:hypothetical protein